MSEFWIYTIPAVFALAGVMLAGHHWPVLEGRHPTINYIWGTGWLGLALSGLYLLTAPTAGEMLLGFWLFLVAAGVGTGFGYVVDALRRLSRLVKRGDRAN